MDTNDIKDSLLNNNSNPNNNDRRTGQLTNFKLDEEIAPLRRTGQLPNFQQEEVPERRTGELTDFKIQQEAPERRTGQLKNININNEEPVRRTGNLKNTNINEDDQLEKDKEQDILEDFIVNKVTTEIDLEDEMNDAVQELDDFDSNRNLKNDKRREYSLSNPRQSMLKRLSGIRKLNCFSKCFRKLDRGSLRAVVLLWIRMTMGVGILTLPALMQVFGMVGGIVCLFLGFCMCLFSYRFIFEAALTTEITDYSEIVNHYMPTFISKIFRITYFIDMISFGVVYSVFGYKLFMYLLYSVNLTKDEWIINEDTLDFDNYNPSLFLLRTIYFIVLYIILIPLLLKKI